MQVYTAIGMMSGTSMDGVDIALVETDGERALRLGPVGERPYTPQERMILRAALTDAIAIEDRTQRPGTLAQAERVVTQAHREVLADFLDAHAIDPASIDVVGFHGQTVLHRPERQLTVQIGDADEIARTADIPVVFDLRAADVAAGGEGAPLVPAWHRALALARTDLPRPLAVVNIGGVGNVTWLEGEAEPVACDTGPGNALLDDLMQERLGLPMDRDGATAASGTVDAAALATLLDNPYFKRPAPKSLDRNDFSRAAVAHLATPDAAATLTAFTSHTIAESRNLLPSVPGMWVVCGGGARNPTLLRMLAQATGASVVTADSLGWSSGGMEAQAFAFLAVRSLLGLPLTFPGTTGVTQPLTGGVLSDPKARARRKA